MRGKNRSVCWGWSRSKSDHLDADERGSGRIDHAGSRQPVLLLEAHDCSLGAGAKKLRGDFSRQDREAQLGQFGMQQRDIGALHI